MGKFLEILETETRPQTGIEKALCASLVPVQQGILAWERVFDAGTHTITARVDTWSGKLHIRKVRKCNHALQWETHIIPRVLLEKDSPESFLLWLDEKLEPWLPERETQKEKPEGREDGGKTYYEKTEAALKRAGFAQCTNAHCWERKGTAADGGALSAKFNLHTDTLYIKTQGMGGNHLRMPKKIREKGDAAKTIQWIDKELEYYMTGRRKRNGVCTMEYTEEMEATERLLEKMLRQRV